ARGAGFVWESDVGRLGMVRVAGNGEIRRFSGVARNTVHNTMFQTVKDREENVNPPPTNNPPALPTMLRAKVIQELNELQAISTYIDSCLENIDQFLNGFIRPPNEIDMDDLEPDGESVETPLVSPFLDLDDDSNDDEVLNELEEYGNVG
nr:hypothetical protein [Tanacetum cinerariifolium]